MRTHMTAAAWTRGVKNATMMGISITLFVFAVKFIVAVATGNAWELSYSDIIYVLVYISLLLWIVVWLQQRTKRGQLVLDCGAHPAKRLFLFCGFSFVIIVALNAMDNDINYRSALYAAIGAFYILMAFTRFQVRNGGLWVFGGMLPWKDIKSYSWTGGAGNTLSLTSRRRFATSLFVLNTSAIAVPIEIKDELDSLLKSHTAPSASSSADPA